MKKLSETSFQKARSFIFEHGRILDQRLFEFHFEGRSNEAVLLALKKYQNKDGRFGKAALEPDLRTPLSTVYTTSQGLFICSLVAPMPSFLKIRELESHHMNMVDIRSTVVVSSHG